MITAPKPEKRKWMRRNQNVSLGLLLDVLARSRGRNGGRMRYVQVGANNGKLADPLFQHTAAGAFSAILIEPSPRYFTSLANRYARNDDVVTINVGIADEEGEMTLYQLAPEYEEAFPGWARGCASMIREELVQALSKTGPVKDEMVLATPVPVVRLDRILEEHEALEAEMLVIDVEGFEANVFRSVDLSIFRPHVILFEYTHLKDEDATAIHAQLNAAHYRMWVMRSDIVAIHKDWLPPHLEDVFGIMNIAEWGDDTTSD
ncbi:MAG: FkbM family methyltransferase [Pseudomonadota bacterium]